MLKIIGKILIIFLVLIIIDQIVGRLILNNLFNKTISGEKGGNVNYLLSRIPKFDFVILGTSRAKYQIDPSNLDAFNSNGYNAGANGVGSILYNSIILEQLIRVNHNPNNIIMQIDVQDFDKTNTLRELSALYPFYQKSELLREYVDSINYEEKIKTKFLFYQYNGKLVNLLYNYTKRNNNSNKSGFSISKEILDTTSIIKENKAMHEINFSTLKIRALNKFIQMCNSNFVSLFIVFTPSYHNELYRPDYNAKIKEHIKKLSNKVQIIDFSNINDIPFIDSPIYWKDKTHMNEAGAMEFTKVLNKFIKTITHKVNGKIKQ